MRYPIAIETGDDQHAYGVAVPDLPGCFSAGDTLDEAITNAEEAILLYLVSILKRPFGAQFTDDAAQLWRTETRTNLDARTPIAY